MRAVNLLPRDEPKRSFAAKRGVAFGAGGGAALITVLFATMVIGAGGAVKEQQRSLDSLNAELVQISVASKPDESVVVDPALVAMKDARIGALSQALGGRIAWDGVLRQVSQVLPEDVWLTSLATAAADSVADPAAVAPPVGVTISGSTYSQDGVARFLSRLSILPALANVRLQVSKSDDAATRPIVGFTVLADLKTGPSS